MKWPAFAVTLAAVASIGTATLAQDAWPTKAVVVVVPFAAGGNTDVLARIFAERLSARLRQQFVIENRAGGGGTTGVAYMTKSAADGYTLGVATTAGLASNAVIMKEKLGYNAERDVAYLYNMATQPNLLVAHPSVSAKTLPELIAWLKANPRRPMPRRASERASTFAARCWPSGRASRCRR
jgi:tripartite-type tricarboxylate transporter receptor subunit TctC